MRAKILEDGEAGIRRGGESGDQPAFRGVAVDEVITGMIFDRAFYRPEAVNFVFEVPPGHHGQSFRQSEVVGYEDKAAGQSSDW